MRHERHLTDEQLLLEIDGELPRRARVSVEVHLARCAECRDRYTRLEETAGRFADAYQGASEDSAPAVETRARLESVLARIGSQWEHQRPSPFRSARPAVRRAMFSAAGTPAVILLVVATVWWWGMGGWLRTAGVEPGALPVSSLTPGATVSLSLDAICNGEIGEGPPAIPASIRQQVLRAYGMEEVAEDQYELDYLITPRLGGATSARNLWPQRYHARAWNAYIKDQLEDLLPRMVCAHQIDLETAQRDLASNWIAAYKKYFGTSDPLSHLADTKTEIGELANW